MPMIEQSSSPAGHSHNRPGDSQKARILIQSYNKHIMEIERTRGEIEAESRRILRDRDGIKVKIQEFGVANSIDLRNQINDLQFKLSPDFYSLESSCRELDNQIRRLEGERHLHEEQLKASIDVLKSSEIQMQLFEDSLAFLRGVSDSARTEMVNKVEFFVTKALEKIFGQGLLRFKIDMKVKQGIPFAEFQLEDLVTGVTLGVIDSYGGGVGDCVSIVLRLALLEMQDPINTGPVVLDETGKFLSDDKQEKFGEFLREWSEQFNRQIILVTHKQGVIKHANRIFKVSKDDSESMVDCVDANAVTTIRTNEIKKEESNSPKEAD